MKKIIVLLLLFMLSGCIDNTQNEYPLYDSGEFSINEIDASSEAIEIFQNNHIENVTPIYDMLAVKYYEVVAEDIYYDVIARAIEKNLVFLDSEYNILWTLEGHMEYSYVSEFNEDEILIEYCAVDGDCVLGLFDKSGAELMSVENVVRTESYGEQSISKTIKEDNGYYYTLVQSAEETDETYAKYEYIKFNQEERIVIYEFTSRYIVDVFFLEDNSMIFSYSSDYLKYDFEHIGVNGEVLFSRERSVVTYDAVPLEDGYLYITGFKVRRKDFDSNTIWEKDYSNYVSVLSSSSTEVVYRDGDMIYTVYNDGTFDEEQNVSVGYPINVDLSFTDGTKIVRYIEDEISYLRYLDEYGSVIWEQEFTKIYAVVMYENEFYVSTSLDTIVKLDSNGNKITEYEVDGILSFITDDGNFVLSNYHTEINDPLVYLFGATSFKEVTMSGTVIWELDEFESNEGVSLTDDIMKLSNDVYATIQYSRIMSCCFNPFYVDGGIITHLIHDGEIQYDFTEHFMYSHFIYGDEGSMFFRATAFGTDLYPSGSKILEMDYEFNIINKYDIIFGTTDHMILLQGDKVFILSYSNMIAGPFFYYYY